MAHEITPWKEPNCSLNLQINKLSNREKSSREINETYGEGGGLNANYRTVEAMAKAANVLGTMLNLKYGTDFVFKTGGLDELSLDFSNQKVKAQAEQALQNFLK